MNRARTIPVKVGAGGNASLAYPHAQPGERSGAPNTSSRSVNDVPGAVLLAFPAVSVQ